MNKRPYEEHYRDYPAFCEYVQALERQLNERVQQHLAQGNPQTLSEEQKASLKQLHLAFQQRVRQAHQAFGVPVRLDWETALGRTGVAVYHDGCSPAHVSQRQATLTRESGRMRLEIREVRFFPCDDEAGDGGTAKRVDATLLSRNLFQARWEAREEAAAALSQATLRMLWAQMKAFFSFEQTLSTLLGPQPGDLRELGETANALCAELSHLTNLLPMAQIFFQDLSEHCLGYAVSLQVIQDWLRELDWQQRSCQDALLHASTEGDLGTLMACLRTLLVALKPLENLVLGEQAERERTSHETKKE